MSSSSRKAPRRRAASPRPSRARRRGRRHPRPRGGERSGSAFRRIRRQRQPDADRDGRARRRGSQLAQLVFAGVVLAVLLFLTGPLQYLPRCVLAGIVFTIAVGLVDCGACAPFARRAPANSGSPSSPPPSSRSLGVEQGILLAIALSLLRHVRHSYRPHTAMRVADGVGALGNRAGGSGNRDRARPDRLPLRRRSLLRERHRFADEVRALVAHAPTPVRRFVVDAGAITDLDYSAARTLARPARRTRAKRRDARFRPRQSLPARRHGSARPHAEDRRRAYLCDAARGAAAGKHTLIGTQ